VKDFSCSEASKVRKIPSEALSAHSKHKLNKQSFGSVARTKLGRSLNLMSFIPGILHSRCCLIILLKYNTLSTWNLDWIGLD